MPSSADQPKTMIVPPLKQICLSSYLAFLESACAGVSRDVVPILEKCFPAFIQLRMNPNPMFKRLTSSMLPALKNHLETTLSGACFSALRLAFIHNPQSYFFSSRLILAQGANARDAFLWEVSKCSA